MNNILLNLPEGNALKLLFLFLSLTIKAMRTHPIESSIKTNYAQQQSQSHHIYLCPCILNRHVVATATSHFRI